MRFIAVDVVSGLILPLFTFGAAIFYILSRIERFVSALALDEETQNVDDDGVRFVHRMLRDLSDYQEPRIRY